MKKLSDYVDDFQIVNKDFARQYNIDDVIKVCKRVNNKKRDFLFVNQLQGKHIPQRPKDIKKFLNCYANAIPDEFIENTLVIGFAETATMLGAYVADYLGCAFAQTSRESNKFWDSYEKQTTTQLCFSEEHSHATAQYFYIPEDSCISNVDNIIICEDEITTGNTILNFVKELRPFIADDVKICVLSVLNWQNAESLEKFKAEGITPVYLVKGTLPDSMVCEEYKSILEADESYIESDVNTRTRDNFCLLNDLETLEKFVRQGNNYRDNSLNDAFFEFSEQVCSYVNSKIVEYEVRKKGWKKVCVLGTEEYMYPAFEIANYLEWRTGCDVRFHATTRSPICISEDSCIKNGHKFYSTGDFEVVNYLYNFSPDDYDGVIVVMGNTRDMDKMNTVDNLVPNDKLLIVASSKGLK